MPSSRSLRPKARKAVPGVVEDGWALRRIAGLEILTARILDSVPWVVHGFSTRKGGASRLHGVAAFNLGLAEWDSRESVTQNRGALLRALADPKSASKLGKAIAGGKSL